jgi:hypothetical protein
LRKSQKIAKNKKNQKNQKIAKILDKKITKNHKKSQKNRKQSQKNRKIIFRPHKVLQYGAPQRSSFCFFLFLFASRLQSDKLTSRNAKLFTREPIRQARLHK